MKLSTNPTAVAYVLSSPAPATELARELGVCVETIRRLRRREVRYASASGPNIAAAREALLTLLTEDTP